MNSISSRLPTRAVLESHRLHLRWPVGRGFALVSTLLLMVLLGVLAVGLLSLSSVSLRTSSQTSAESEARANAKLALMIAIGELQKQMGSDQRVSASGAILDTLKPDGTVDVAAKNRYWTGVWDSWKAGTDEASQHSTIQGVTDEMAPTYAPNRSDHFRSWLLSLKPGEASEILNARDLVLDPADADVVQLVGKGSLGEGAAAAADFVNARLLTVNSSATGSAFRGRYGWWVGDESQKARLMGLLASLKGKPVAYLDKDKAKDGVLNPDVAATTGTPVASFNMPNAIPDPGSSDPASPGQWLGSRELSDTEIGELATAMVKQVKLRGPFLSLSEFVNRRLDASDPGLSVKGALQAALDDTAVSINAGFRNSLREFSAAEKATMTPAFPEALDGPVAYGSSAYVDQADVLRNFAAQLTPRGDTFVIRAYGDVLDPNGTVMARAWCEAVVQRVPDYYDSSLDESYEKFSDLAPVNKTFGRKFTIVSFRWLNDQEV